MKKMDSFQGNIVISFVFSMIASALNYFFQIMIGNMLSVEEFGTYNLINSLAANVVTIFGPLAVIACKYTAANCSRCLEVYYPIVKATFFVFFVVIMVPMSAYPALSNHYGMESIFQWFVLFLMIGMAGLYNVMNGVVQGLQNFIWYGVFGVVIIVLRVFGSIIYVNVGLGVYGIVIAMLLGYLGTMILMIIILSRSISGIYRASNVGIIEGKDIIGAYGGTFISQLLMSFYLNGGEIILMGYRYDERQIGLYSSGAMLGKVSLYVISIISVVLLPKVVSEKGRNDEIRAILYKTLGKALLLSILYVLFLLTIGQKLILLFFGETYRESLYFLPAIAIFVVPLGLLSIVHSYFLAIDRIKDFVFILGFTTVISIIGIWGGVSIIYVPVILGVAISVSIVVSLARVRRCK